MRKFAFAAFIVLLVAAACTPSVVTTTVDDDARAQSAPASVADGFSCDPHGEEPGQFSGPTQVIRDGHDYVATITMDGGDQIVLDLMPDKAPITVNNFVFLACQGFYDGVTFHRVIPDFMAQGGDPTGTGTGGPGYTIQDEHGNGLVFDREGLISMAHTSRPNSAGSQFFITYGPTPHLNGTFTIFGEVVEGYESVLAITPRDPQQAGAPGDVMQSVRIEER